MCGIVGLAGNLKAHDEQLFKLLLLLDYFRGQDSTGMAVIDKDNGVKTLKVADDPIILMQHADFEITLHAAMSYGFLGHNRASTVGLTTRANAHPFTHGSRTGVHNGTLSKLGYIELGARLDEDYGTDSETIYAHMAKYGVNDTIERLEGAYALVWFDSEEGTVNMYRNDERPLWIATKPSGSGSVLLWASESEMLSAASCMVKTGGDFDTDEEGFCYYSLPKDTLHTWKLAAIASGDTKPTMEFIKGRPTPPKAIPNIPAKTPEIPAMTLVEQAKVEVTEVAADSEDPFKGLVSDADWDYLASYGCSWCGATLEKETEGLAIYLTEQAVLCPECSGTSTTTINGTHVCSDLVHVN